jgi:carbonic anhydrase/acetyltransferase-like protein (isoleucine patch superfamily)
MPAYQLDQFLPDIDPSCWIAPCATIIGNVVLGSGSSIWFGSVVRGDNEPIVIGERINIQDGCIAAQRSWQPVAYRKRYNGRTSRRRTWLHHRDCIRCRPSAPRCDDRVAIAPTHQTSCCAAATIAPQPRVIACTQSTRSQIIRV